MKFGICFFKMIVLYGLGGKINKLVEWFVNLCNMA